MKNWFMAVQWNSLWGFPSSCTGSVFPEDQKIGMVLTGVNLANHAANSRAIVADYYKQIFRYESEFFVHLHDFNMRKPLAVGAYLILAFYDQDSLFP
jgi:hypothetical protein